MHKKTAALRNAAASARIRAIPPKALGGNFTEPKEPSQGLTILARDLEGGRKWLPVV